MSPWKHLQFFFIFIYIIIPSYVNKKSEWRKFPEKGTRECCITCQEYKLENFRDLSLFYDFNLNFFLFLVLKKQCQRNKEIIHWVFYIFFISKSKCWKFLLILILYWLLFNGFIFVRIINWFSFSTPIVFSQDQFPEKNIINFR